MMTVAMIS